MTANTGRKLILVVEDQPDEQSYVTIFLQDNGYDTATANNGNQAMEKVKEKKPDLITLDITMPEKSGLKFYREIKGDPSLSGIPVIVISGVTGFGGKSEDFEAFLASRKQVPPPEGFIGKPVDRDLLLDTIAKLLA